MVGEMYMNNLAVLFGTFLLLFVILAILLYIYMAVALMAIAKRTKTPYGWLAFIPIANIYLMTQVANISGWWTLIVLAGFIPFIGSLAMIAAMVYFWWLIAERVRRPGWWGILMIVPIVNLILMGIMAWGKK